jgi:hypothetical protein
MEILVGTRDLRQFEVANQRSRGNQYKIATSVCEGIQTAEKSFPDRHPQPLARLVARLYTEHQGRMARV